MGYTHYWYRPMEIPLDAFRRIVEDFKKLVPELEQLMGIKLAGPLGHGEPEIDDETIAFNGPMDCGHTKKDYGVAWPDDDATGVAPDQDMMTSKWFGGGLLAARSCSGDCSHESFILKRVLEPMPWQTPDPQGRYFQFCKTAFKPYDLAVNVALIIAKRHLGDSIIISSDGGPVHWKDAKLLCQVNLGYGLDVELDFERDSEENVLI